MNYILSLSFSLCSVSVAYSQTAVHIGPRIGLNVGTAPYESSNHVHDTRPLLGGEAGIMATASKGNVGLHVSVLYSQKGFRIQDEHPYSTLVVNRNDTYALNYLVLPVSVAYSLQENGQGLQVFAGGYLGMLLHGRYTWDDYNQIAGRVSSTNTGELPIRVDNVVELEEGGAASKRWDAGLQAGIGYRYNRLLLQLSYSYGLVDLGAEYRQSDRGLDGAHYYHRVAQLSAAYFLGRSE
ncbi:hypothetical protein GCM10027346_42580 [Hymenobacter seoulensis]